MGLVSVTYLLADGLFKNNVLCSKNSLMKIAGYQQPTCLCVRMAFVVDRNHFAFMWIVVTFVPLFSFMWGRYRRNCVWEMVFRFTHESCSAAEVACLAENIRHSSAGVWLRLVVLRCLLWTITLGHIQWYWVYTPQTKLQTPLNCNMKIVNQCSFLNF